MKKVLSLFIACCMLLSISTTAFAASHSCSFSMESQRRYYQYDNTGHWEHLERKCQTCGKEMYVRNPDGFKEEHVFYFGACTVCGYVNQASASCAHARAQATSSDETKYEIIPDDYVYHRIVSQRSAFCSDCNAVVQLNTAEPKNAVHIYTGDGTCTDCGFQLPPNPPQMSAGQTGTYYVTQAGNSYTRPASAPGAWAADCSADWIHITPFAGYGSGTWGFSVDPNNGDIRSGTIVITFGTSPGCVTIHVIQLGVAPTEHYLSVDQGHINGLVADVTGGQGATITVASNVAWQASEGLDWVSLSNTSGNGNGSFTVYVDANTGTARDGYITVSGEPCDPISIFITQPGATNPIPAVCNHVYDYDYADASDGEWQSINDDYHKRVTLLYKDVCTLCGDVRYQRRADEAAVKEKHTWGKISWAQYNYDENEHWRIGKRPCTAKGCDYVDNLFDPRAAHTLANGVCTICGYTDKKASEEAQKAIDKLYAVADEYALLFPYDVLTAYTEQRDGISAYMSTVVYQTLNTGAYLKMQDLSLDARNHVQSMVSLVDSMEDEYYVESTTETNDFLDWLLDFKVDSDIKNSTNLVKTIVAEISSDIADHSKFQNAYMDKLHAAIDNLDKADSATLKTLVECYNRAANKNLKYEQLLHGLRPIEQGLKNFGNAVKYIGYGIDVKDIFRDYSNNLAKLSVLQEACRDNDDVVEALEYLEGYYSDTVIRGVETGEKWVINYAIGNAGGGTWAIFTTALALSPANRISNSFMTTYSLSQISDDMKYDLLTDIQRLAANGNYEDIEAVRKEYHAWIDMGLLAAENAINLTAEDEVVEALEEMIDLKEDLHSLCDEKIDAILSRYQ